MARSADKHGFLGGWGRSAAEPPVAPWGFAALVPSHPGFLLAILPALLLVLSGCAAYRVGNETLYAPDVSTVYVPMIESDSFRRDLGERLTEAVIKEIELKTPFKVVGTPDADSVLSARIVSDTKRVIAENQNDDPRSIELNLLAEVTWYNRRRMPLTAPMAVAVPPALLPMGQAGALITEAGQSIAVQQQLAIQRLAEQIVATMEEPW
ncbi:MAG: hypothetical protein CMJ58_22355 [Planctomycetaceae bacterium]|nr:hypothetical protein [Planctomycetaceae bacterium]